MKNVHRSHFLVGLAALTILGKSMAATDTHEPYRPLIIMGKNGRALKFTSYFDAEGERAVSHSPLPFYIIGKDHPGAIQADEFEIHRFPGSSAPKKPWLQIDARFRCVAPTERHTIPIHPFMQEYGKFLTFMQEYHGSVGDYDHLAQRTFYVQQRSKEHVDHLMSSLRAFEVNSQGLFDSQGYDTHDVSLSFVFTNVFVHPSVTLHDLQQLINRGIQQKENMFYLEDATYFMLFLN